MHHLLLRALLSVAVGLLAACGSDSGESGTDPTAVSASPSPSASGAVSGDSVLVSKASTNKVDPVIRPGAEAPVDSATDPAGPPTSAPSGTAARLFASGFGDGVQLTEPEGYRLGDRHLIGGDLTGNDFQTDLWSAPAHRRHWILSLVGDTEAPATDFLTASLKSVTGRAGGGTRALSLHSHTLSSRGGYQQIAVQSADLGVEPVLYQRMWIKFDPQTLARAQAIGDWHFSQTFWEAATPSDYRIRIKLRHDGESGLYWQIKGEDDPGGDVPSWQSDLKTVPVAVRQTTQPAGTGWKSGWTARTAASGPQSTGSRWSTAPGH